MKAVHRIRRYLILLLFLLHTAHSAPPPPDAQLDLCGNDNLICVVHSSCLGKRYEDADKYYTMDKYGIENKQCARYLLIRGKNLERVEVEFRDDKIQKNTGVEFHSIGNKPLFTCKNNVPTAVGEFAAKAKVNNEAGSSTYDKLYCKFAATPIAPKNILEVFEESNLAKVVSMLPRKEVKIEGGVSLATLNWPCSWDDTLFKSNANIPEDGEDFAELTFNSGSSEKECKATYFNWYKSNGDGLEHAWKMIDNKFTCDKGKITTTYAADRTDVNLHLTNGRTKCSRPLCAMCSCPSCNGTSPSPNFTDTDGTSCTMLSCEKHMLVKTGSGEFIHPSKTLSCSHESTAAAPKWTRNATDPKPENRDYTGFVSARCVDDISCKSLDPIMTACPQDLGDGNEHRNCTAANLDITTGINVCPQGLETWFKPPASIARQLQTLVCNSKTGKWDASPSNVANVESNATVYCLKPLEVPDDPTSNLKGAGMPAGKLIGIIVGVAVVLIILIAVGVYGAKLYFKKKGNRDEMKSVSVTGRGDKKGSKKKKKNSKKDKKGSSSKTSEQISAPPPPPCPDSVPGMHIEPDPVLPNSSAPPSSGGAGGTTPAAAAAAPPVVGPDTGKPDKPAELIDIKLESEKKTDKESKKDSKKEPKDADATIVNTVTGTQSGAEPVKKDKDDKKDATVTGRTDKNGVSEGRSDTGKDKKKKKDIKKELDRHGRGLTDDDDYNIDEGAKPVNNVDKNKKPYIPAVDPNKKMINVTMTEDDEGHQKPREKPPLF